MENTAKRKSLGEFLEEAELQQYSEMFRNVLKISKISQLKFVVTDDLDQIGLSKPEQRRYKKIFSKYFPNPYLSKLRRLLTSKKHEPVMDNPGPSSAPDDFHSSNDQGNKIPTKHIICIEDITINKELGKGQFGVVQQGTWTTGNLRLQVAIKCLGQERMTSNSTEFLKEAAVMHSIEHPNIVRLYGVVLHSDSLMLVTELAPLRSLLECLREIDLRTDFLVPTLCDFAEQICDGMHYLENKRLIHRDLAARNILVFSKDRVKISDFGLSRALGVGKDYYQTNYNVDLKLPVAWCAPECILFLRFTSSSDVWAFAVCLWEMFTYGFQPWAGFSGQQILEAIDNPNLQRLERPQSCPEEYFKLMLQCWAHEPSLRPKFKDLSVKLRTIRPDQVQALCTYQKCQDNRRGNFLEYKRGEIITVLGREDFTHLPFWYGVVSGGACGLFEGINTQPYESDPPKQIVSPYKPSDDSEQIPLINPNSPSHLTGASGSSPYPILAPNAFERCRVEHTSSDEKRPSHKGPQRSQSESSAGKGILSKMKNATLGRPCRPETGAIPKTEEVHEYHEINDNEPAESAPPKSTPKADALPSTSTDFSQSLLDEMETMFKNLDTRDRREPEPTPTVPKEPGLIKRSQTLTKSDKKRSASPTSTMKPMSDKEVRTLDTAVALANEITSKSMNDLDGEPKQKYPHSPNDRSKFAFKFPLSLHHNHHDSDKEKEGKPERRNFSDEARSVPDIQQTLTAESKLAYTSLIEEPTPSTSMMKSQQVMSQLAKDNAGILKTATMPKPGTSSSHVHFHSLQKNAGASGSYRPHGRAHSHSPGHSHSHSHGHPLAHPYGHGPRHPHARRDQEEFQHYADNPLPLPPRTTKPKLVDKPRHIRKYPLRMPSEMMLMVEPPERPAIIYQNTAAPPNKESKPKVVEQEVVEIDVHDGPAPKTDTNPFKNGKKNAASATAGPDMMMPGPSGVNPFASYDFEDEDEIEILLDQDSDDDDNDESDNACALFKDCKDHVSVEDLLEFANQRPCGRQRGLESDEVRVMRKVFKEQVPPEECLQALELCLWDVHNAIKLVRVSVSVGTQVSLELCSSELAKANGDISKASAVLGLCKQNT